MRTRSLLILAMAMILTFGIVSASAAQNRAQDYSGGYIGFIGGVSHYNAELSFEGDKFDGISAEGFNFGVMGGYGAAISSDKYFGLEGNIGQNFAKFEAEAGTDELEIEPKETYGFNARLGQVIGDWMAYGLVGWQWVNVDLQAQSGSLSATEDEDFDGPRFGLGAEYQTTGQVFVRGEYSYTMYDEEDAFEPAEGSFKLGFGLRF